MRNTIPVVQIGKRIVCGLPMPCKDIETGLVRLVDLLAEDADILRLFMREFHPDYVVV